MTTSKGNNPHGLKVGRKIYTECGFSNEPVEHVITEVTDHHAKFVAELKTYHVNLKTLDVSHNGVMFTSAWPSKRAHKESCEAASLRRKIANWAQTELHHRQLSLSQLREAAKALGIESKGTQ